MNQLLAPIPLPDLVDEVQYSRTDDIETMTLRAGRLFSRWPYTITDCYSVGYVKRSLFSAPVPVRYLDDKKLEPKRKEMFGHAYDALIRFTTETKTVLKLEQPDTAS
jgi:hypothetical protein